MIWVAVGVMLNEVNLKKILWYKRNFKTCFRLKVLQGCVKNYADKILDFLHFFWMDCHHSRYFFCKTGYCVSAAPKLWFNHFPETLKWRPGLLAGSYCRGWTDMVGVLAGEATGWLAEHSLGGFAISVAELPVCWPSSSFTSRRFLPWSIRAMGTEGPQLSRFFPLF